MNTFLGRYCVDTCQDVSKTLYRNYNAMKCATAAECYSISNQYADTDTDRCVTDCAPLFREDATHECVPYCQMGFLEDKLNYKCVTPTNCPIYYEPDDRDPHLECVKVKIECPAT